MIPLTPKQQEKLQAWMRERPEAHAGAIGGRFTYMVTPTGLGVIIKIRDNCTKEEIDLTSYEEW